LQELYGLKAEKMHGLGHKIGKPVLEKGTKSIPKGEGG